MASASASVSVASSYRSDAMDMEDATQWRSASDLLHDSPRDSRAFSFEDEDWQDAAQVIDGDWEQEHQQQDEQDDEADADSLEEEQWMDGADALVRPASASAPAAASSVSVSVDSAAAFEYPALNRFPMERSASPGDEDSFAMTPFFGDDLQAKSIHSDEFVDAAAYLESHRPGEDSFLREVGVDASDVASWTGSEAALLPRDGRHASDIFQARSCSMNHIQFDAEASAVAVASESTQLSVQEAEVGAPKTSTQRTHAALSMERSETEGTVLSADDIHVDNRAALTPNSFRQLQERMLTQKDALQSSSSTIQETDHAARAEQIACSQSLLRVDVDWHSSNPERTFGKGPPVIKKALHKIESLLADQKPLDASDASGISTHLQQIESRWREPIVGGVREDPSLDDEQEDSQFDDEEPRNDLDQDVRSYPQQNNISRFGSSSFVSSIDFINGSQHQQQSSPRANDDTYKKQSPQSSRRWEETEETAATPATTMRGFEDSVTSISSQSARGTANSRSRRAQSLGVDSKSVRSSTDRGIPDKLRITTRIEDDVSARDNLCHLKQEEDPTKHESSPRATDLLSNSISEPLHGQNDYRLDRPEDMPTRYDNTEAPLLDDEEDFDRSLEPYQTLHSRQAIKKIPTAIAKPQHTPRRSRRLFCCVGETITEHIAFSNSGNSTGRICVALIPLSAGCQQFSITPAVLELPPRSSKAFVVHFQARTSGVVVGIFQFRAVGRDRLFEPYEVLMESIVRDDLLPSPRHIGRIKPPHLTTSEPRVRILSENVRTAVQITPTFVRFLTKSSNDKEMVANSKILITNDSTEALPFQIKCAHEHVQITPARGSVEPGAECQITVSPLSRPFNWDKRSPGNSQKHEWFGSLTVVVGDVLSREISLVLDAHALNLLPPFVAIVRSRHAVSPQSDSFYYTKRVNRKSLYFHARAVECGSCRVGESHQVPVYICNGSDAPMTVFLQTLQEPFSCSFTPTTLQARKFIEVPITFSPKAPGKVATSLVASSIHQTAAVTLIARGVSNHEHDRDTSLS